MSTFAALGEKSGQTGSFLHCVNWALADVEAGSEPIFQIVRCRAGEPEGKVIAQVHEDGFEPMFEPTYVLISRLIDEWLSAEKARVAKGTRYGFGTENNSSVLASRFGIALPLRKTLKPLAKVTVCKGADLIALVEDLDYAG